MKSRYTVVFLLLLVAQVLLMNFFNFTQMLTITFLPVMMLCFPTDKGTKIAMLVAFAAGFAVNFLGDGMLGLASFALVPIAFLRNGVIRLVFGSEVFSRGENISIKRQGVVKIGIAVFIMTGIYLILYIWADGAGTHPMWFNFFKFLLSWVASSLISFFLVELLTAED